MALYTNFNQINEFMKLGSSKDSCWTCAKKLGTTNKRDAYETLHALEGKLENKPVIVIRRSGVDTCICMDCVKEVYDKHIAPTLPVEVKEEQPKEEAKTEAPVTEDNSEEPKKGKKK